jgi:hypothetical protein
LHATSPRPPLQRDATGAILVDRDPTHFKKILNFLRDGYAVVSREDAKEVLQEARFYQVATHDAALRQHRVQWCQSVPLHRSQAGTL